MALTLANLYAAATSVGAYSNVVSASVAVAAVAVVKESDQTPNHAARLAWAIKTLADPQSMGKKVIWGVLADPIIIAAMPTPSDALVQASVNALVDDFVNA